MMHMAVTLDIESGHDNVIRQCIILFELWVLLCVQIHIEKTFEKHAQVQNLVRARQTCLKKLTDKHVRPVQPVAPCPENPSSLKSPIFSPKHGKIILYSRK